MSAARTGGLASQLTNAIPTHALTATMIVGILSLQRFRNVIAIKYVHMLMSTVG